MQLTTLGEKKSTQCLPLVLLLCLPALFPPTSLLFSLAPPKICPWNSSFLSSTTWFQDQVSHWFFSLKDLGKLPPGMLSFPSRKCAVGEWNNPTRGSLSSLVQWGEHRPFSSSGGCFPLLIADLHRALESCLCNLWFSSLHMSPNLAPSTTPESHSDTSVRSVYVQSVHWCH